MSLLWWFLVPIGYLIGSIPSGLLISKKLASLDVREYGSRKTGMANVLRTVGMKGAVLVVISDGAKGSLPVLTARLLTDNPVLEVSVALAILMGHNWSLFIGFRGGRGIIPGWAAITTLIPLAGMAASVGVLVIAISRYISLGSLIGVCATIGTTVILYFGSELPLAYLLFTLGGGMLIIFQHRGNILRLLNGTERRLGQSGQERTPTSTD